VLDKDSTSSISAGEMVSELFWDFRTDLLVNSEQGRTARGPMGFDWYTFVAWI
jgi:hypothetical protein